MSAPLPQDPEILAAAAAYYEHLLNPPGTIVRQTWTPKTGPLVIDAPRRTALAAAAFFHQHYKEKP